MRSPASSLMRDKADREQQQQQRAQGERVPAVDARIAASPLSAGEQPRTCARDGPVQSRSSPAMPRFAGQRVVIGCRGPVRQTGRRFEPAQRLGAVAASGCGSAE